MFCVDLKSVSPPLISTSTGPRTQKTLSSISSLHITTWSSAPISNAQNKVLRLLTSKSFQIRREGTANEKGEGKKLLGDKGRIEYNQNILERLTHLRPKEHWQATVAANEHHCNESTPSCRPFFRLPYHNNIDHQILTNKEYAPAAEREDKTGRTQRQQKYVLRRKVVDFTSCGVVLLRECEEVRDA